MGLAPRLVGIVQAPGLSRLFGCTLVSQVGRIIAGIASAAATAALLPGGVPGGAAREGGTVNCSSSRRRRARPPNLPSLPFNSAAPEELVDELGASVACLLQSLVRPIRHILPAQ